MKEGKNYPLFIERPENLDITFEQFEDLSNIGIGSLFISWPCVIRKNIDEKRYEIYGSESKMLGMIEKHFKGKKYSMYEYSGAEMIRVDIPFGDIFEKELLESYSASFLKGELG
jgi:hypothetical protein